MPLSTSPIDGSPMRHIKRYGVEIDICPTTGGIWLDEGELERIVHSLQEKVASEQLNLEMPNTNAGGFTKIYNKQTALHYG